VTSLVSITDMKLETDLNDNIIHLLYYIFHIILGRGQGRGLVAYNPSYSLVNYIIAMCIGFSSFGMIMCMPLCCVS
jgi:hypothetical protein